MKKREIINQRKGIRPVWEGKNPWKQILFNIQNPKVALKPTYDYWGKLPLWKFWTEVGKLIGMFVGFMLFGSLIFSDPEKTLNFLLSPPQSILFAVIGLFMALLYLGYFFGGLIGFVAGIIKYRKSKFKR